MNFRKYAEALHRQRWVLLIGVVIGGALLGGLSARQPDRYQAVAQIVLAAPEVPVGGAQVRESERWVSSQREIVLSVGPRDPAAQDVAGATAEEIRADLSATASTDSYLLRIGYTDESPARAAAVVDAVVDSFVDYRAAAADDWARTLSEQIDEQIAAVSADLELVDAEISVLAAGPELAATAVLVAERDALGSELAALRTSQRDASLEAFQLGTVEVLERPQGPGTRVDPSTLRLATAGAIFGLLGGLGVALFRESVDEKVRSVEGLEAAVDLPVLAQVPVDREPSGTSTASGELTRFAEQVRSLRATLRYFAPDGEARRILVTSAGIGEGKSLLAANLAAAYAVSGYPTVLVDADLRRPSAPRLLGESETLERGLSTILQEGIRRPRDGAQSGVAVAQAISDAVVSTSVPQLALLPAGPPGPAIAGMDDLPSLLELLTDRHSIVVVDTPPLLSMVDVLAAAEWADVGLIVAAFGESTVQSVERCRDLLRAAGCDVVGVVINKVPVREFERASAPYGPSSASTPETRSKRHR